MNTSDIAFVIFTLVACVVPFVGFGWLIKPKNNKKPDWMIR